jgi:hypothetical protein
MTTPPQTTLSGFKSKIHKSQDDFPDPNSGKPPLDDVTEYVFRLVEMPRTKTKVVEKKDSDGTVRKVDTIKATCVFEEEVTKNEVITSFRVDSLNFSEDESYESGIIKFFKKIKTPLVEGETPDWDKYFIVGMRIRGRVVVKKTTDKDDNPVFKYYLDVPTCRPILQSDKHPDSVAPDTSAATLKNALFLTLGSTTYAEAEEKLKAANAPKDVVLALFQANLDGKLKYPIGAQ